MRFVSGKGRVGDSTLRLEFSGWYKVEELRAIADESTLLWPRYAIKAVSGIPEATQHQSSRCSSVQA